MEDKVSAEDKRSLVESMSEENVAARIKTSMAAGELVDIAKQELGITFSNALLDDEDIRGICKWVGQHAPDTIENGDETHIKSKGIDAMLFISLSVFPWFYERYELSQMN